MHDHQSHYDDYPVVAGPEEVNALKDRIASSVARSASVLLTIYDTDENGSIQREVRFEASEARGSGGFISYGTILPQGTEASVRSRVTESGTEYLELVADLSDRPSD